jgi:hypothetical protein
MTAPEASKKAEGTEKKQDDFFLGDLFFMVKGVTVEERLNESPYSDQQISLSTGNSSS